MKINNYSSYQPVNNYTYRKSNQKQPAERNIQSSANEITANYNVAFQGLFRNNNNNQIFDAKLLDCDLVLRSDMEFEVSPTSKFKMGDDGYVLDLSDKNIKPLIANLKKKQEIVLGREPEAPQELLKEVYQNPNINFRDVIEDALYTNEPQKPMDMSVSRKHLKIRRDKYGKLIAQDLNSTYGTVMLHNIETPNCDVCGRFKLVSGIKYMLPLKTILRVGNTNILLLDYQNKINKMSEGDELIVGTDKKADIKLANNTVSPQHLKLIKHSKGLLVEDLSSADGSMFLGILRNYDCDYSNIQVPYNLKSGVKTRVPNNSQLYVGNDLTIDLRNRNILNELNNKGKITVGRSEECDFVVPSFYDKVSRKHLQIEKDGNDIVVTDLSSTNGTTVVPARHIKPFYGDLSKLCIKQNNTGDCYLLSTIYSMSQNPKGRRFLQNMVRVDNNGNYIVKFNNSPELVVAPDEMDGQIDKNGKTKYSVCGDLGIKAIERAYGKLLKSNSWFDSGNKTMHVLDKGGFSNEALFKITGISSDSYDIKNNINLDNILYQIAYTGGTANHILTCSTPYSGQFKDYVDPNHQFIRNHAYSIQYVDTHNRTIGIVNPHNTKYLYQVTWDNFKNYFDYLYDAKTDFVV